jgi:competence protein ComEC
MVPAHGYLVLGRGGRGGPRVAYAYGGALALANDGDWLILRDARGRTVDSVAWRARVPSGASRALRRGDVPHADLLGGAWTTSTSAMPGGDRGTPGAPNDGGANTGAPGGDGGAEPSSAPAPVPGPASTAATGGAEPSSGTARVASEVVVRLLDVGQGDATLITNGGSTVLIDGGPDPTRMGVLLDSLELNGTTIDVVIATHTHIDHYNGLRELFRSKRHITVRYFYENQDPYPHVTLAKLRDSINARVTRGEMLYRDTDDPCLDGRPICTITMRGGARLRLLRPRPIREPHPNPNDRSAIVKLVGPDSASFTMWLAGDGERDEIAWMQEAGDATAPGMAVRVLKADHHGSCNGITAAYLDRLRPEVVVMSVGAVNDYGHVHEQTKRLLTARRTPWYRTDQNGTITIRSPGTPGGGYSLGVLRGGPNESGRSDRASMQGECGRM